MAFLSVTEYRVQDFLSVSKGKLFRGGAAAGGADSTASPKALGNPRRSHQ
jgi:hypothetical protein